jgi:hypothetical protein
LVLLMRSYRVSHTLRGRKLGFSSYMEDAPFRSREAALAVDSSGHSASWKYVLLGGCILWPP